MTIATRHPDNRRTEKYLVNESTAQKSLAWLAIASSVAVLPNVVITIIGPTIVSNTALYVILNLLFVGSQIGCWAMAKISRKYNWYLRIAVFTMWFSLAAFSLLVGRLLSVPSVWLIMLGPLAPVMLGSVSLVRTLSLMTAAFVTFLYAGLESGFLHQSGPPSTLIQYVNMLAIIGSAWVTSNVSSGWQIDLSNALDEEIENSNQEMVRRGKYLIEINHDLRNPLTAMLSAAEALATKPDPAMQQELLSTVDITTRHLLAVLNDVLENEKITAGKLDPVKEPFSLRQCLVDVRSMNKPRIDRGEFQVTIDSSECPDWWLGDVAKLRRVLVNIVSNSIKHGGRNILISAVQQDEGICIEVTDDGPGIPESKLKSLFVPFQAANSSPNSLGLGLPICKRIVEETMLGKLTIESTQGSTLMRVWIPAERTSPAVTTTAEDRITKAVDETVLDSHSVEPTTSEASMVGCSVLLVEDDNAIRETFSILFASGGAIVWQASTVEEAMQMMKDHRPMYLVVDRNLGHESIDGVLLTEYLLKLHPSAIVIGLSGNASAEVREEWMNSGAREVLVKPTTFSALRASLLAHRPSRPVS